MEHHITFYVIFFVLPFEEDAEDGLHFLLHIRHLDFLDLDHLNTLFIRSLGLSSIYCYTKSCISCLTCSAYPIREQLFLWATFLGRGTKETFVCACSNYSQVSRVFERQKFDHLNFEGGLSFNRSSVSQVKDINIKTNSTRRQKSMFQVLYGIFSVDRALLVDT